MQDPTGKPRTQGSSLTLLNLLQSLGVDIQCALNNAGNDAFLCLLALQLLLDPEHTKIPSTRGKNPPHPHMMGMMAGRGVGVGGNPLAIHPIAFAPSMPMMTPYGMMPMISPPLISPPGSAPPNGHRYSSSGDSLGIRKTASQMQMLSSSTPNLDTRPRKISALSGQRVGSGDGKGSSGPSSGTTSEDEVVAKLGGMKVTSA